MIKPANCRRFVILASLRGGRGSGPKPDDEAPQAWFTWARGYADWLDPLTDSLPQILDELDPFTWH